MNTEINNIQKMTSCICEMCRTQEEAESLIYSLLNLLRESPSDISAADPPLHL